MSPITLPPIIVACRNRLRYLDTTLKSLSATLPAEVPVYVSVDGTTNSDLLRYVTTNEAIPVLEDRYPNRNRLWMKHVGILENELLLEGIDGLAGVLIFKDNWYIRNFSLAVKRIFDLHLHCQWIIRVEGDVIFTAGWYETLVRKAHSCSAGLISGFRHLFDRPLLYDDDELFQCLYKGTTGAQLLAISRNLCLAKTELLDNQSTADKHLDDFWYRNCEQANRKRLVSRRSLCQHIGWRSEIYTDFRFFMINGRKVRAFDRQLSPSFPVDRRVRKFFFDEKIKLLCPAAETPRLIT